MAVKYYQTLQKVTKAVTEDSGCYGADPDVDLVAQFLEASDPAQSPVRFYVRGILLLNFYAYCTSAIDADRLWEKLERELEVSDVSPPENWTQKHLGEIATHFQGELGW